MASRASTFEDAASRRRRMSLPTPEIPRRPELIDQLFERGGIELLFTHQIDQNTWIEIAAARAHDDPAGRGQSHAGVDRFAPFDRGDACAIAEMGDYQAVRQIVSKLVHDRFARKAVKPV